MAGLRPKTPRINPPTVETPAPPHQLGDGYCDTPVPEDKPLRLLIPVGSAATDSTKLFWATAHLANRMAVQVVVLHCREWDLANGVKYFRDTIDEANAVIATALSWFDALHIPAHGLLRDVERGSVGIGIADTCGEYPIDSIMVGLHRKRRIFHRHLGSTIAQIERRVDCPVIIINLDG
ncbi:MAG: universal stress protein [Ferrimicrobium sp.]|uniref:universal stress protein n=1 Tax=Ferrimicrobium sp. TaxID=2926050 RepID=UPI0026172FED|nr:universal stress protein [Ferrimicrobium sp.]